MAKIVEGLLARFNRRKEVRIEAARDALRNSIVALARAEAPEAKSNDIDADQILDTIEAVGMSEEDLRANVDRFKKRERWAPLAAREEEYRKAAEDLAKQADEFEAAEVLRHRAALDRLAAMRAELPQADARYAAAVSARGDLLATAPPVENSAELMVALAEVNAMIATLEEKLDSRPGDPGHLSGDVDRLPGRLLAQTREMLRNPARLPPAKLEQLERQREAAAQAVAKCEREIRELKVRRSAINAQLTMKPEDALKPENFALIRTRPAPGNAAR
jgi:chromosome segregation ATPase